MWRDRIIVMGFRPICNAGNVKRFCKYWTRPRVVIGCNETRSDGGCGMKVCQRLEPFAARLSSTQHLRRKTRITTNNSYSSRNRIRFPAFPNQSQKMRIRPLHNTIEISPRLMPRRKIWGVLKNGRMNQRRRCLTRPASLNRSPVLTIICLTCVTGTVIAQCCLPPHVKTVLHQNGRASREKARPPCLSPTNPRHQYQPTPPQDPQW